MKIMIKMDKIVLSSCDKMFLEEVQSRYLEFSGGMWPTPNWHIYLKGTGHRPWRPHIAWSASAAGIGLFPYQCGGPRQPLHPWGEDILSLVMREIPCLFRILTPCVLCKVWQE